MKGIVVRTCGGPEVLIYTELSPPTMHAGEVLVRLEAIGVNRRDALIRSGAYKRPLPLVPGIEGAGVIEAVGDNVTRWRLGQRVIYYVPDRLGAYAELQSVPADRLVELPAFLSARSAVAIFDHGLTAHYLTMDTFAIEAGSRVLVQAAAGGVGSLIVQFAKRRGATVYGTVSSVEKAEYVSRLGADHVILHQDGVAQTIRRLTGGEGVHVVYDSIGKESIEQSLASLRRRGLLVLYGQSSGPVDPIDPRELADRGSLYLTRPHLLDHITPWEQLKARSDEIFSWVSREEVTAAVGGVFQLQDAPSAHRRLADRRLWGKLLLTPA